MASVVWRWAEKLDEKLARTEAVTEAGKLGRKLAESVGVMGVLRWGGMGAWSEAAVL